MKFVFVVLFIFIASIALEVNARELSFKEKAAILNVDKIYSVQEHTLLAIDPAKLPIADFLSYKILKNSCRPLEKLISDVKAKADDFEDQSAKLATLVNICAQSVVSLVYMDLEHP